MGSIDFLDAVTAWFTNFEDFSWRKQSKELTVHPGRLSNLRYGRVVEL
ncbi:MAG TPA: hypothetical protein VKT49_20765 [Bryobacteraceae bacterium]|nr:hypothetical protein [Bryobacteraceae bacterium]